MVWVIRTHKLMEQKLGHREDEGVDILELVLDPVTLCVAVRRERLLSGLPGYFAYFNSANSFVLLGHGNQGVESRPPVKLWTGNHWFRGELRVAHNNFVVVLG